MIRGAVYPVDLGDAKHGHEQSGRRLGLVISIEQNAWSTVTMIPTSTSAQSAVFRPDVVIAGRETKILIDQVRTIDTCHVTGELVPAMTWARSSTPCRVTSACCADSRASLACDTPCAQRGSIRGYAGLPQGASLPRAPWFLTTGWGSSRLVTRPGWGGLKRHPAFLLSEFLNRTGRAYRNRQADLP
jgi:mRNA interferase MazF